jgi:hypothetical protein
MRSAQLPESIINVLTAVGTLGVLRELRSRWCPPLPVSTGLRSSVTVLPCSKTSATISNSGAAVSNACWPWFVRENGVTNPDDGSGN